MTFSIAGLCPRTGEMGCVLATSSMAAGARAQFIAADAGVVLAQARSDPRLGVLGIARLRDGDDARQTLDAMVAASPHAAWRQLAVVDRNGQAVAFTGAECAPATGELTARGVVAVGNGLANERVVPAMLAAFQAHADRAVGRAPGHRPGSRAGGRRRGLSAAFGGAEGGAARRTAAAHRSARRLRGDAGRRAAARVVAVAADDRGLHPALRGSGERARGGADRRPRRKVASAGRHAMPSVTCIRNAACIVAWDATPAPSRLPEGWRPGLRRRHDRLRRAALRGCRRHDIDGRDLMVMPGLVDIHSHPSTEPFYRGVREDHGVPAMYMSGLYERSFAFRPTSAGRIAGKTVAYCEMLLTGVTSVADLSGQ